MVSTPRGSRFEPIDEPIRAELFSVERLEQHARSMAEAHDLSGRPGRLRLIARRLADNGEVLLSSYRELSKAIREEALLTPAAEWLVDNFHLVESQLREIRENLPPAYYRELPKTKTGHLAGYPRVYGIAWAYVAHLDSRFDPDALRRFVSAYQETNSLTIGELWAIPITLRLILIENLRRMAEAIVLARRLRREADQVADGLLGVGSSQPADARLALDRYGLGKLPQPFAVQLLLRLRDHDPESTPGLTWLLDRLTAEGTIPDDVVNETHRRQAASNVTVRNIVTSLRHINSFDWADFVEEISLVDRVLSAESLYSDMSFATRDRYRHRIEALSKASGTSELDVAMSTLELASAQLTDRRQRDPGYFLLGEGRDQLEAKIGFRPGARMRFSRFFRRHATGAYLGSIAVIALVALALPLLTVQNSAWRWVLALLALIPATDIGVTVVNRAVAALTHPEELPALALRRGPTADLRTLVAIPALLSRPEQVDELVERLEVHYLANPDGEIHFALVSDWRDAEGPELDDDAELLEAAAAGVARLNHRHGEVPGGGDRFLIFHRRRLFNPGEDRHMGWERKRGKLHELNRLLRGASDTTFIDTGHEPPERVRYVIALDADSRLPPGAATRLVATMAHPLNRARVDEPLGWVVEGYGVLQPRVTAFLGSGGTSFFQRVFFPPAGHRPVCGRGQRRLSGPLRRRLLRRQGDIRDRLVRGGARRPDPRERPPQPRPLRRKLRPGGPGQQRRSLRGVPEPLRGGALPSAPLGPGRLATAALDPWQARSAPSGLPFEDGGQPAPQSQRPGDVVHLDRIVPGARCPGLALDRVHPRLDGPSRAVALARAHDSPTHLDPGGGATAALGHRCLAGGRSITFASGVPGPPGPENQRRDRRNALASRGYPSRNAELGDGRRRRTTSSASIARAFIQRMGPSMVTGLASSIGAALVKPEAFVAALGWSVMWVLAPFVAHRASIPRPVRVADLPTASEQEALRLICPADLALLRTVRHE